MGMDERWATYNDQSRDAELIAEVNQKLQDLEPLIHCPDCATEGGVSLDDIDLWSRLRSLTIVKGLVFPPKVRAYLDTFADRAPCRSTTPLRSSVPARGVACIVRSSSVSKK